MQNCCFSSHAKLDQVSVTGPYDDTGVLIPSQITGKQNSSPFRPTGRLETSTTPSTSPLLSIESLL